MDFKTARRRMVDSQVRTNDVTDLRLQAALETVPREVFLPADLRDQAYVERELPFAPGRSLMTVRDFAKLAAAAKPKAGELCLSVASGTGYATAVLAQLVEMVVAVETDEALAASAQENLTRIGVANAAVLASDSAKGAAGQGPFDLIFIDGVIETRPDALLAQLKDDGRLAAIMRRGGISRGVLYSRAGDATACSEKFDASAKMVLPGFAAEKSFVF
ncbi:protein-L-isoaspartate O-methyltransferase family protein [Hyphococcus sp.]|uniref:protein-L-isoaspartate O-methyltransferase family protein n=1 Tax=Hyphococcus sp. TaxID=2038636 RepID=UPI0020883A67|nr:MAG: protein-L-isoaspartate O-methyltransferase [Marinicaulis sp.]